MSFISKIKNGVAAAVIGLGIGGAAQAAPLASASYTGSYSGLNTVSDGFAVEVDGVFTGMFDPLALAGVSASTTLKISAGLDIGVPLGPLPFDGSVYVTAGELMTVITDILSSPIPPEVTAFFDYVLGNSGVPIPLGAGTFSSTYLVTDLTDYSVTADFDFAYAQDALLDLGYEGPFDGAFEAYVTVASVPLPASLPLLVVGLGGIAALRRKRAS